MRSTQEPRTRGPGGAIPRGSRTPWATLLGVVLLAGGLAGTGCRTPEKAPGPAATTNAAAKPAQPVAVGPATAPVAAPGLAVTAPVAPAPAATAPKPVAARPAAPPVSRMAALARKKAAVATPAGTQGPAAEVTPVDLPPVELPTIDYPPFSGTRLALIHTENVIGELEPCG